MRPHRSSASPSELEAIEEGRARGENADEDGDGVEDEEGDRRGNNNEVDREGGSGGARGSTRKSHQAPLFPPKTLDEKWEQALDMKLKPIFGEVDVGDYGGRDIDE